jgi:hypothetical protein
MLAFCTSPSEISLVLGPSDARWLSEEMSFLAELYRSKAGSSERQFGRDDNLALASFWETALKCQRLAVALQQAVSRGSHASSAGRCALMFCQQSICRIQPWLLPMPEPPPARLNARPGQSGGARRRRKMALGRGNPNHRHALWP